MRPGGERGGRVRAKESMSGTGARGWGMVRTDGAGREGQVAVNGGRMEGRTTEA